MPTSLELLETALDEHRRALLGVAGMLDRVADCAARMRRVFAAGGRVFVCGNGGSAADAQHFAAELTGRFEKERAGFPAVALTTDTSALTAIGNDYGFDAVFSRQLEALGQPGDLLIVISTSGNSRNLCRVVSAAKANGICAVGLLGRDGGRLVAMVDIPLVVAADRTARIQEMHIFIIHAWCELLDAEL